MSTSTIGGETQYYLASTKTQKVLGIYRVGGQVRDTSWHSSYPNKAAFRSEAEASLVVPQIKQHWQERINQLQNWRDTLIDQDRDLIQDLRTGKIKLDLEDERGRIMELKKRISQYERWLHTPLEIQSVRTWTEVKIIRQV